MIDIITCPHCQRRLTLPPEVHDCDVQCPGCKNTFRAGAQPAAPPTPSPRVVTIAPEPPRVALPDDPAPPRPSIARRPPPRQRRRGKGGYVLAGVGIGLVALCVLCAGLRHLQTMRDDGGFKLGKDLAPQFAMKEQEDIFAIAAGVENLQVAQQLQPLLMHLARAFRAGDSMQIVAQFDVERALERMIELDLIPRIPNAAPKHDPRIPGLRNDLQTGFGIWAPQLAWNSAEVLHVQKKNDNDFAVVVRHRNGNTSTTIHLRWWLTRRDGGWRIYDMEDLDLRFCFSALTGVVAEGPEFRQLPPYRAIVNLRLARQAAVVQGDTNAAERLLKEIAVVPLPSYVDTLRWAVAALVPMHRGQPRGVLDATAKARALKVDLPILDLFEAIGCNRGHQYARALPLLEARLKFIGDDWETNRELGNALVGLGRTAEGRTCYRKSLDRNPLESDALLGLLRALGDDDAGDDLGGRLLKFNDPTRQFEKLSDDCRQRRDGRALERLAQAVQRNDPNSAAAQFALALARAWAEQPDSAVVAFRAGLALERDPGKRNGQTTFFLQAMASSGLANRAYAVAADPREAFRTLAAELKRNYRMDDLRLLVAAHARRDPNDQLLPWYRGELLVQRGQYAQANQEFKAGLATRLDAQTVDVFRPSRVMAYYHTGKALTAYATIGPARQTFQQLAMLARQDHDDALLEKLIDAHARADADDPELYRQRVHLKIVQGDTAAATALLRAQLDRKPPQHERERMVYDFLSAMVNAGKPLEAYAAVVDMEDRFDRVGAMLINQHRLTELRQLMAEHRKRHADDLWLDVYTGLVHLKERKWSDAARVLSDLWLKAPAKMRGRIRYDLVYALYKEDRWQDAYEGIESPAATFTQLTNLMLQDKKAAELLALIELHRAKAADDVNLRLVEARTLVLKNQPEQAIKLWQDAYRREQTGWARQNMIRSFVLNMHAIKRGLDAYRAAPDQLVAFQALAPKLVQDKDADTLGKLLQVHAMAHPTDRLHGYYRAEHELLIGQPAVAATRFAGALAGATPQHRWMCRNGLYRARVRNGQAVQAYRTAGSTAGAFRDVASMCFQEKNATQLKALIAAHRAADPDEPTLLSWDLQALWLEAKYAAVLAHLDAHANTFAHQPLLRFTGADYRVRALVKLKRFPDAIKAAEAMAQKNRGDRLMLLLAYAAAGDAKGAIAALERPPTQMYLVQTAYTDADLGPLLRGEAMRMFRERYPEPAPSAPGAVWDDED